ncbi:MAG: PTS sugar transporter subunit IIA [Thermoanaerobaculales bacterium]|nr:PTS sugar transporter subunit IIA [Thermoanaerobaculales bacterium]
MKIHKLIEPAYVFLDLEADDVSSALTAVAGAVAPGLGLDETEVVNALLEREALGSTSVGDGFAIPHCKIQGLNRIGIALARLTTSVGFGPDADPPVSFLFVVLSPPDQPAAHLQVLSQIARVLKRSDLRTELLVAEDRNAVVDAICRTANSEGL